jgi:hypothetical protein
MKKPQPSFTSGTSYGKGPAKKAMAFALPKTTKKEAFKESVKKGKFDKQIVSLKGGTQLSKAKTATAISKAEGVSKRQRRITAQEYLGVDKKEYKSLTRSKASRKKSSKIVGRAGSGVNLCRSPKCL